MGAEAALDTPHRLLPRQPTVSLRARLFAACLGVLALAMGLMGSALIAGAFDFELAQARQALTARGGDVARAMEAAAANYTLQGIALGEDMARDIAAQLDAELADGPEEGVRLEGHQLHLTRSISLGGRDYTLALSGDVSEVFAMRHRLLGWYVALYALTLGLCALALGALARALAGPLERLAQVSARIAGGEYGLRAAEGDDETGRLARSFNLMADELTGQMERRDRFIADLSHELKTPLTAMLGHAELIRAGGLRQDEVMLAAQYIFREGRRLSAMQERLMQLTLMGRDPAVRRRLSAGFVAEEACAAALPRAAELGVALECRAEALYICADEVLLRALLGNLIDNALKSGARRVQVSVERCGGRVALSVSDDGRGMEARELSRITEPFYRVDKSRSRREGGAGLGLALCAEIARLHGGELMFRSAPGAGTRAQLLVEEASASEA